MLHLKSRTSEAWASAQLGAVSFLLVEQAHLEKKAASGALRYMFRYAEHVFMQVPLSEVAREELEHFERVMIELDRRSIPLARQRPVAYAAELVQMVRAQEPDKLLDQLLCNSAVEARSCERMMLLARAFRGHDEDAAALYHELVGSEARHHELYVDLARRLFDPTQVEARLAEVMQHEAAVVQALPVGPGLHSGDPESVAIVS